MFVSLFASMMGLVSLFNYVSSNHQDLNHMLYYEEDVQQNYITGSGGMSTITFSSIQTYTIPLISGSNVFDRSLRYYIPSSVNGTYIGYLEFYCSAIYATQQDTTNYWLPSVVSHIFESYNLRVAYTWHITNSSFPSTNLDFGDVINLDDNFNYSYQKEKTSLISSQYTLSMSLDIMLFPMTQEEFGNTTNTYINGYNDGYEQGYTDGHSDGYQLGYTDCYQDNLDSDSTAQVIFTGIINVGLLPINFFLACLNFEVFGINIGGFVSALLTIAIVVIILRIVLGGKKEE